MPWGLDPSPREDLVLELRDVTDGSGDYTGEWIDTAGTYSVRVVANIHGGTPPTIWIEEGQYDANLSGPQVVRSQSVTVSGYRVAAQLDFTARYFRWTVLSGSPSTVFEVTIRRIP